MTFVAAAHQSLAIGLFALQVILGVWGLALGLRRLAPGGAFASGLIVDEGLIAVQSILGGIVLAGGRGPQPIHFLYAGLLLGLLPVIYTFSSRRPERAGIWLGLTLLFMAGLILRAAVTGRV